MAVANLVAFLAVCFMSVRYARVSSQTHESFLRALHRAEQAGANEKMRLVQADYVDFLRRQNRTLTYTTIFGSLVCFFDAFGFWQVYRQSASPASLSPQRGEGRGEGCD